MKTYFVAAATALAFAFSPAGAQALEIVNQDEQNHVVILATDDGEKEIEIAAGETANEDCTKCIVQVGEGEPMEVQGDAVVVIKDGVPAQQE